MAVAAEHDSIIERLSGERRLNADAAAMAIRDDYGEPDTRPTRIISWIRRGIKTNRGTIRLDGYLAGNVWYTSRESIVRFFAALTKQRMGRVK